MNDIIRVGDLTDCGRVVAIDGPVAWTRNELNGHHTVSLVGLTRIEPEKVVLTPRFAVGQEVKKHGLGEALSIEDITVTYAVNIPMLGRVWWRECDLEPVPKLCPECKGSGVASE